MTTSSTYTWELTRDQIITDALRKVGAIDEETTPTATQLTIGARTLNGVAKVLAGSVGMPLWAIDETSFSLTATASYLIGVGQTVNVPKPIKILQAWKTTNSIDTPVRIISIDEYNNLANKASTGTPVNLSYEPELVTGTIKIYPVPDTYSISNTTIKIRYHRQFQDFTAASETPDFPQEWHLPLTYHLAYALAPDYGTPTTDKKDLLSQATMYTQMALEAGYENASIEFRPDIRK